MTLVDGASDGAAQIGGHYTKVLADANSVACPRERERGYAVDEVMPPELDEIIETWHRIGSTDLLSTRA
jgi:hypothetical protein